MATVTHYIHSHYNPEDRDKLERETGQLNQDVDPEMEWEREAALVARRRAPPPRFVAATIPYDDWSVGRASSSKLPEKSDASFGTALSGWYRSLSARSTSGTQDQGTTGSASGAPQPASAAPKEAASISKPKKTERRTKNNWFIMNAIQSEPLPASLNTPSTLADMLERHPPPRPSEPKFAPPVFLEIGPSNVGFGMLQRSGWTEGEPLGPDVIRRRQRVNALHEDDDMIPIDPAPPTKGKGKGKATRPPKPAPPARQEQLEVKIEDFDDVSELRNVDVIDLTLDSDSGESQSEAESDGSADVSDNGHGHEADEAASAEALLDAAPAGHMTSLENSPYARKALLTPIATVLKSDRLGIGLKAKTVGPYKASQKRVTHNAAALAAHVRAAEESRRRKQIFGRGNKGFERQRRRDEEKRKALLAELKSPW